MLNNIYFKEVVLEDIKLKLRQRFKNAIFNSIEIGVFADAVSDTFDMEITAMIKGRIKYNSKTS